MITIMVILQRIQKLGKLKRQKNKLVNIDFDYEYM